MLVGHVLVSLYNVCERRGHAKAKAFGVLTLAAATMVILSNLPAPNPMAMWNCKPTTASFLDHPAPVQGFYGSQFGYIIGVIAVRKYLGA